MDKYNKFKNKEKIRLKNILYKELNQNSKSINSIYKNNIIPVQKSERFVRQIILFFITDI